jgi:hypothetical protein
LLLDELEFRGGELVAAIGDVRSRVELLELPKNALRLGLFGRDWGCRLRRRDSDAQQTNEQRGRCNLPLERA